MSSSTLDSEYCAAFQELKDHVTNEVVPCILKAVPALSPQRMHGQYEREFHGLDGVTHNLFRAWAGGSVHWITHLDITAPHLYATRLDGWLSSPSTSPSTLSSVNTAPHFFSEIALMRTDPGPEQDNMFFFMDFPPRVDLRRHPKYVSRYYEEVRARCVLPFENNKATFTCRISSGAWGTVFLGSPAAAYYSFRASEEALRTIKEAIAEYARLWCTFITAPPKPSSADEDEAVDLKEVLECDEALKAYLHRNPMKQQMIREHFGEEMRPQITGCMDGTARNDDRDEC